MAHMTIKLHKSSKKEGKSPLKNYFSLDCKTKDLSFQFLIIAIRHPIISFIIHYFPSMYDANAMIYLWKDALIIPGLHFSDPNLSLVCAALC